MYAIVGPIVAARIGCTARRDTRVRPIGIQQRQTFDSRNIEPPNSTERSAEGYSANPSTVKGRGKNRNGVFLLDASRLGFEDQPFSTTPETERVTSNPATSQSKYCSVASPVSAGRKDS